MKRDRFSQVMRFLHLNDNSKYKKGEPGHDPLYKLWPFLTPLIANFQSSYTLHREVSVDESMDWVQGEAGFHPVHAKEANRVGHERLCLVGCPYRLYIQLASVHWYVCVYMCMHVCVCMYGCMCVCECVTTDHM